MHYLVVSPALEDPRNVNILQELHEAADILGLKTSNLVIWNYPRRELFKYHSEIRQKLFKLVDELNPDVIFTTTPNDLHQDHSLLGEETVRLFRDRNVLGYEVVNSSTAFWPDFYVELDENSVNRKIEALMKYTSQLHRYYFKPEAIESLARTRGVHAHCVFAEAFQVLKMIMR